MQDPGQAPAGDAETAFAAGNIGVVYGDALYDPPHYAAVLSPPAPPPMPVPAMMPAAPNASASRSVWLDTPLAHQMVEKMVEKEEVVGSGKDQEEGEDDGEVEEEEEEEGASIPPLVPVHATAPTSAPTTIASVYYSAVFLTPASIATLQARYPPCHATLPPSMHMTLAFQPDAAHLNRLLPHLGEACLVRVLEEVRDGRGQALRVDSECPLSAL